MDILVLVQFTKTQSITSFGNIYPSNYNTSKFNLVESEVGTSYKVLGVITNVGVYVYANNESLSSSPAAGFNGVSGSSTLVF